MCTFNSVLLVDDNEIDNFVHKKIIERAEVANEILAINSAQDALKYLEFSRNAPEKLPDLILLDINMPHMNGFEFLEAFARLDIEIRHRCRIVMLSSSTDLADRVRAEDCPYVAQMLTKPLSIEVLHKLPRLLEKARLPHA